MLHKALLAFGFALGVVATTPTVATDAQHAGKVWRIGFLRMGELPVGKAFWDALRDLSWIEGRNIELEPRYADSRDQLPALAAELVKLKVDVIITNGSPATRATKQATTTIPIVFFLAADPVRNGFVTSLARPGGNATGFAYGLYGHKMLEIVKVAMPELTRVAYPVLEGELPESTANPELSRVAAALGLQMQRIDVRDAQDFASFYEAARNAGAEAVLIPDVPRFVPLLKSIGAMSRSSGLPGIGFARQFAEGGGLLYYGPTPQHWPRIAALVDKILKGASPADLPVEQASKFELVINQGTANALGLILSPALLLRADEVIP